MTEAAGRVLAIDLGTVRVGLAVSDPLRLTGQPFGQIPRRSLKVDLTAVSEIVERHDVGAIVVGHPLLMSGEAGERAKDAETFADRLRAVVRCPVVLWDERLTTVQAQRALIEGHVRRKDRREVVDATAAAVLLQSRLDAQPREGPA